MALITQYSDANKVVDSALTVTYAKRRIYGQWSHVSLNTETTYTAAWEYERHATMSIRYVGMTFAAAQACAEAMVAKYTRSVKISEWDYNDDGAFATIDGGSAPMADVAVQLGDGSMYNVVVSVNEQDSRTDLSGALSFSTIFSTENARTY